MSEEEVNGSMAGHQDSINDINSVFNPIQSGEMGAICLPPADGNAIFNVSRQQRVPSGSGTIIPSKVTLGSDAYVHTATPGTEAPTDGETE
uniref:Uncharacterized protein n=1 Tax=Solanum tuberosum TaxID=4113 RepID=M1DA55_SOLTU